MRETPMNFDTHKSIKFLIEKGMKESQAESIVEIVSRSRSYDFSKLATKDQLKILEAKIKAVEEKIKSSEEKLRGEIKSLEERLRGEIKSVEERLRGEIISVKHEILRWMLPFLIGILLTVLTIFFK